MPNVPNNVLQVDNLAHGADWNDGLSGRGGTASKSSQIKVYASNGALVTEGIPIEELPDSPTFERAEQCTVTHHYRMSWIEALTRISFYGRGVLLEDSYGNFYRVLSSTIQRQTGNLAILTVVSESVSFDVPPDEFSITPVKMGLDILKHPRYFYALMPTNQIPNYTGTADTPEQISAKQQIVRAIQAYRENPFIPTPGNINNISGLLHDNTLISLTSGKFPVIQSNPNYVLMLKATDTPTIGTLFAGGLPYPPAATAQGQDNPPGYWANVTTTVSQSTSVLLALRAAQEIIGKLWRMEDSPMINGIEVTHSEYFWYSPRIDLGGYIQDPRDADPQFPDYFYYLNGQSGENIFQSLAEINPQCFSSTGKTGGNTVISWLRDADVIDRQRTIVKRTRKWLGAPVGAFDSDIYSKIDRPDSLTYTNNPPYGYRPLVS